MNLWGFEAKPVLPGSGWGLLMSDGVVGKIVVITPEGARVESSDYNPAVDAVDGKITDDDVSKLRGGALKYIQDKAKNPDDPFFKALEEAGGQFTIEVTETKESDTDNKKIPGNAKPVLSRTYKEEGKNLKDKETALVKVARDLGINDELISGDKASFANLKGKVDKELANITDQMDVLYKTSLPGSGGRMPDFSNYDSNAVDSFVTTRKTSLGKRPVAATKRGQPFWKDPKGLAAAQKDYDQNIATLDKFSSDAKAFLPKSNRWRISRQALAQADFSRVDTLIDRHNERIASASDRDNLNGVNGGGGRNTSDSGDVPNGLVRATSGGGPSSIYMHSASGGPGGGSEFGFGASTGFGGIDGGFGGYGAGVGFSSDGIYSDFTGIGSTIFGQHVDNQIAEKKLRAMLRRMKVKQDYDILAVLLHVVTAQMKLTVIKSGFQLVNILEKKLQDQEKITTDLKELAGQKLDNSEMQRKLQLSNLESNSANNLVQLAMGMFKQNHAALEEMSNETNAVQRDIINFKRDASRSA